MKVMHYSASLSRSAGGLHFSVSGLSKALAERGVDVRVVGGADEHFAADSHIWGTVSLHPHPLRWGRYALDPHVLSQIRRHKPDLLHIQGIWSAASIYGRIAALMNIPIVVSPRGMLDPWILARRPVMKAVHAALFERPMLRRAHLHALNDTEESAAAAFMPSLRGRIFVVPNGIPPADTPASEPQRQGALYIGRLHPKKQVQELAMHWRGCPSLAGQQLIIAGWGERAYEEQVRAVADAAPNVNFVGPLYGEAKMAALRKARFFILPSLSEGLPMAVLEAIQYGCIPVITDACNLPKLFRDGIALRIAADFGDFASVMTAALAMPETEMRRLSAAGRSHARRYLWSTVAARMQAHYERILASGR